MAHETDIYNNISAQTQVGIIERMLLRNDIEEKCGVRSVKTFSTYQVEKNVGEILHKQTSKCVNQIRMRFRQQRTRKILK